MKAKIILGCTLALLFVILLIPQRAEAQVYTPPDSCLRYTFPVNDPNYFNPDSVKTDTCHNSLTHGEMYTKKFFCDFLRGLYIFTPRPLQIDTLYTWKDIDSINHNRVREYFKSIEDKYGRYYFIRDSLERRDSDFFYVPNCIILFDNYICSDSITNEITSNNSIDSVLHFQQRAIPGEMYVKEKNINPFKIIINEQTNILKILWAENVIKDDINISIYSILGTEILKYKTNTFKQSIEINITELNTGIYFIVINNKFLDKFLFIKYK